MMRLLLILLSGLSAATASAAPIEKPLFSSDQPIQVTISGPISTLARNRSEERRPATLMVAGTSAALPITLSPRGITRRRPDTCQFPPLNVRFTGAPPAQSVFAGQTKLKLVTHCRSGESFQKHVLLEYAAYRMFNVLTPLSFRVRLASIDYVNQDGRKLTSRMGFFIEDPDDVAKRNGMTEARLPERTSIASLDPRQAALFAMFQHMISNHDWSMTVGPAGEECCHNAKLIAPARAAASGLVPVPYDFDFSGFVNAPYAVPPEALRIQSVRQRQYRGYCTHNRSAIEAAARIRAARGQLLAALAQTPGLDAGTVRDATNFLQGFFADIATDETVRLKVLRTCGGARVSGAQPESRERPESQAEAVRRLASGNRKDSAS